MTITRSTFKETHLLARFDGNSDRCCYYPSLPQLVVRGNYVQDDSKTPDPARLDHKKGGSHPSLGPGVFLISCVHGEFLRIVTVKINLC